MLNATHSTSTRPYLIRALYEWCIDNGFTPFVAVLVDDTVMVPREYVNNGEIVLNVSYDATSGLNIGNDFIEFKARFAGVPRDIMVPVGRVIAIYARENGQGMSFPVVDAAATDETPDPAAVRTPHAVPTPASAPIHHGLALASRDDAGEDDDAPHPPPSGGRPALKRVK